MTNEPETKPSRASQVKDKVEGKSASPVARHAKQPTRRPAHAGREISMPAKNKSNFALAALIVVAVLVIAAIAGFVASCHQDGAGDAAQQSSQPAGDGQPGGGQSAGEAPEEQAPEQQVDPQQHAYYDNRLDGVSYPDVETLTWRDADFAVDAERRDWPEGMNGRKVVYLTIDDGPSERTQEILDILDRYNAKATFFVVGHEPDYYGMIAEAYRRGHTIGLHSMTHSYEYVYSSTDDYFQDLTDIGEVVREQIGYVPCFIRFPGGSSNTVSAKYTEGIMTDLTQQVQDRGYQYYDWNSDTGDGAGYSTEAMIEQVCVEPTSSNIMMLCHDSATKENTVEALPTIIEHFQSLGYSFEALDRSSWICHHGVNN